MTSIHSLKITVKDKAFTKAKFIKMRRRKKVEERDFQNILTVFVKITLFFWTN